jgi:pimeloyl-ACP methyl ester carboxylesterase
MLIVVVAAWRFAGGRASPDIESAVDDLQIRAASVTTQWLGVQPDEAHYGIKMFDPEGAEPDEPWSHSWRAVESDESKQTPQRLVLLLHGLDEPGQIFNDLAPALAQAGYAVARFDYPNDQSPAVSADLLGESLAALGARGTQHVDLVAHSMGGLVARDALTRDTIYNGDGSVDIANDSLPKVDRLILVGTPNLGSPWARLRAIGEIREQIVRYRESGSYDPRQLLTFLSDGLGDAGEDLLPGSDFLAELNARPLPQNVEITTIIGEIATAEGPELAWVHESKVLRKLLGNRRMAELVDSIDELLTELGDGVVTARSARLEGVDDAPMVAASHRGMLLAIGAEKSMREALTGEVQPPPAIEIILERLGREAGGG